ncbi:hypothetical protein HYALB_00005311 [Hymenoscyphus albidus]|uniref:2EXR domain-containing protein n=1 Tax=Hymenoscyphus albidus TaxID=595503 RepID=A0A9N9M3E6_9HELO|nr:hypothetical protein HYALB_00005311 [Hymenoscyphus albidus]
MASPTSTCAEGCDAPETSATCGEKDRTNENYRSLTIDEDMEIRLYCCGVLDRTHAEYVNLEELRAMSIRQAHQTDIELFRLKISPSNWLIDSPQMLAWKNTHDAHYQIRENYDRVAAVRIEELRNAFQQQLLHQGIKKTRDATVPAYTFVKFLELPVELRHMIWVFGTGHRNPRERDLEYTRAKLPFLNQSVVFPSPESDIFPLHYQGREQYASSPSPLRESPPSLLHTCRESRAVAQKIFFALPCNLLYGGFSSQLYFNSLFDNFYMEGTWASHDVILICLLAKFGSKKAPLPEMLHYINLAQAIRNMTVSIDIFVDIPIKYWAEFTSLRTLSIGIYHERSDTETPDDVMCFPHEFLNPIPESNDAKRAEYVLRVTTKAFESYAKRNPKFKSPKLDVVIQHKEHHNNFAILPEDGTELEIASKWDFEHFQYIQLSGEKESDHPWIEDFLGKACRDTVNRHEPGVACACLGTFVDEVDLSTMFDWVDGY